MPTLLIIQDDFLPPPLPESGLKKFLTSAEFKQPFLWLIIFFLFFIVIYFAVRIFGKKVRFIDLVARLSPFLLPLLWVYGILFSPPASFDSVNSVGFSRFYFNLRNFYLPDNKASAVGFIFVCISFAALLIYAYASGKNSVNVGNKNSAYENPAAVTGLLFSISSAFCLYAVCYEIMYEAVHSARFVFENYFPAIIYLLAAFAFYFAYRKMLSLVTI